MKFNDDLALINKKNDSHFWEGGVLEAFKRSAGWIIKISYRNNIIINQQNVFILFCFFLFFFLSSLRNSFLLKIMELLRRRERNHSQ